MSNNVRVITGEVYNLYPEPGVTSTVTGNGVYKVGPYGSFQANITGTGAVTATVVIDVSNDNVNWVATPAGTITLNGTTSASDGFTTIAPWKYVRARVTAITGTGATVQVYMAV